MTKPLGKKLLMIYHGPLDVPGEDVRVWALATTRCDICGQMPGPGVEFYHVQLEDGDHVAHRTCVEDEAAMLAAQAAAWMPEVKSQLGIGEDGVIAPPPGKEKSPLTQRLERQAMTTATNIWEAVNKALEANNGPAFTTNMREKTAQGILTVLQGVVAPVEAERAEWQAYATQEAQAAAEHLATVFELAEQVELAWGIIANAHGGNWDLATPEWKAAAIRWRDKYQETKPATTEPGLPDPGWVRKSERDTLAERVRELEAVAKEMRARLFTVPVNKCRPMLCEGDFKRWDTAIYSARNAKPRETP